MSDHIEMSESTIDISMLPEDLQRDAPTLTVNRQGNTDKAYMVTDSYLGYAEPDKVYTLSFDGFQETPAAEVKPLPSAVKPPHSLLTGQWNTEVDFTIEDANILGGNGRYLLPEGESEVEIAIAETTPEHLAYYGCHLVKLGEAVKFTSTGNLPVTVVSVGEDYPEEYLLDPEKGGGAYLEVHDRPHFHMPMNDECGGYLIIGKRNNSYLDTNYLENNGLDEVSAFKVPFGYGVYMAPWAIHSDAYLVGQYMVIYSATSEFSTVILRKQNGELAKIRFV